MERWGKVLCAVFLSLLITRCKETKLRTEQYINWIEDADNGLRVTKSIGEVTLSLQYKPMEYILAKEQMQESMNGEEKEKRINELGNMQYYNLTYSLAGNSGDILKYNLGDASEYQERIYYFSFHMQEDIFMIEGNDTLPCELFHFERYYGLSPKLSFSLGFKNTGNKTDKQVIIDDNIYGSGPVKFIIALKDIQNIPLIID